MSKVSLIIPVYNAEQYIERCISSALNQTEPDIEVVLVDDGSTDNSLQICNRYRDADQRVIVVHKNNEGPHSARKRGIQLSNSKWVAFIDADDWIEDSLIHSLLKAADINQAELVAGGLSHNDNGIVSVSRNQISDGLYDQTCIRQEIYEKMLCSSGEFNQNLIPSLCGKLFLRDKLLPIAEKLDNDIRVAEDLACTLVYVLECHQIYVDSEINGYHYCRMTDTLSHEYDADYFRKIGRLIQYFDRILIDIDNEIVKDNFEVYKVYLIYRQLIVIYQIDKKERIKQFCGDFSDAIRDNRILEPLRNCSIKKMDIGRASKVLLYLLKAKNIFVFRLLCHLIFYKNFFKKKKE